MQIRPQAREASASPIPSVGVNRRGDWLSAASTEEECRLEPRLQARGCAVLHSFKHSWLQPSFWKPPGSSMARKVKHFCNVDTFSELLFHSCHASLFPLNSEDRDKLLSLLLRIFHRKSRCLTTLAK